MESETNDGEARVLPAIKVASGQVRRVESESETNAGAGVLPAIKVDRCQVRRDEART